MFSYLDGFRLAIGRESAAVFCVGTTRRHKQWRRHIF
jgi:hypothetical protein